MDNNNSNVQTSSTMGVVGQIIATSYRMGEMNLPRLPSSASHSIPRQGKACTTIMQFSVPSLCVTSSVFWWKKHFKFY